MAVEIIVTMIPAQQFLVRKAHELGPQRPFSIPISDTDGNIMPNEFYARYP